MSSIAVVRELPPGVHPEPTSFWRKYIFSLDHKVIGKQYLSYALFMLVIFFIISGPIFDIVRVVGNGICQVTAGIHCL